MQLSFELQYGKKKSTEAMKTGKARHEKLEEEVIYVDSNLCSRYLLLLKGFIQKLK